MIKSSVLGDAIPVSWLRRNAVERGVGRGLLGALVRLDAVRARRAARRIPSLRNIGRSYCKSRAVTTPQPLLAVNAVHRFAELHRRIA